VYRIGDRVKKRYGPRETGTVIEVNGRWLHVKHDKGEAGLGLVAAQAPRFDYEADELEHINPLLRLVAEL